MYDGINMYNSAVRLTAVAYDKPNEESLIVNVGVYGALSTFYVSAPRAREMAEELLRVAEIVEGLQAKATKEAA